tara:strand:- start:264 stop:431 length:168 start_codon:yes stop_codon:yes gene_type:complete
MKVGDKVRHLRKKYIGTIAIIDHIGVGVMLDLSDEEGVMFRYVSREDLQVIHESG